ncbi:MAG: polysaccharide deacetylase family protein [Flavobacteriales bacterium]|nr:polysaccharide deacetylase family protein [Flavobacteriales bacterium]
MKIYITVKYFILSIFTFIQLALFAQPTVIKHAALTMDNMPVAGKEVNVMWVQGFNYAGAKALAQSKMPMVGFANEKNLIAPKEKNIREAMIGTWLDSGMEMGNGTFSAVPLSKAKSAQWFIQDIKYGERVLSRLADDYDTTLRYFRYPEMDVNVPAERLDSVNYFLNSQGYTAVTATIRFEDELFNTPYINSKIERDTMLVRYIGERYLEYVKCTLDYYEELAKENFTRQITHIISLRCSEINNDMLGYMMYIMWQRGYRFVSLDQALSDPLYRKHLPERYQGGFFWDYAVGVTPATPPQPGAMIKALYKYQTY